MSVGKEVPPVVIVDKFNGMKPNIGPLVVMSGFLTRKNRTFNRWKQRWWQLHDNGMLFYYKNDNRGKLLGQIDVAHTCYDVKIGRENCNIPFPRVAPSCCCFSFTVLKRSYYLYAPTAAEARKWAESLRAASRVLNRRVVAGVERRKAPDPPGPLRPPSCPPNMRINRNSIHAHKLSVSESMDDSYEMSLQLPNAVGPRLKARSKLASSMPDLLDRAGYSPSPIAMGRNPNDRLWLDGSPYPVTSTTFGQVFPSVPASYSDDNMFTSMEFQESSASLVSSPTSASSPTFSSPLVKENHEYAQLGQGATALQCEHLPETGRNMGTTDELGHTKNSAPNREPHSCQYQRNSMGTGELRVYHRRRIPSRSAVKNRCSLPIIFEHAPERQEQIQSHRPASCIPNPISSSATKSNFIQCTKSSASPTTRVAIFPGAILGDLQKKMLNGNLAVVKQTYPQPLPRNRNRAQSVSNHLDSQNTAINRPMPKPRRSKVDQSQLPGLERTVSCDFISSKDSHESIAWGTVARVLQATSSTESERSVSLTTSSILTANSNRSEIVTKVNVVSPRRKAPPPPGGTAVTPPRPKRDSGPPSFIPPPPPPEELDSI